MWIQRFANFKGYVYTDGNSNGIRWFMLEKRNPTTLQVERKEVDIWDELNDIAKGLK